MITKFSSIVVILLNLITIFNALGTPPVIPDIPQSMIIDKSSHPYGGNIISVPDFDLTSTGADWTTSTGVSMNFAPLDGINGCYWLEVTDEKFGQSALSTNGITIQPNRNYYVSALVYCDFDRDNSEINIGMRYIGMGGLNATGLPASTSGWQRFEWMFTTDSRSSELGFSLTIYDKLPINQGDVFCISDVIFIEMPIKQLKPYSPGEGMTFGGSSGNQDMSINGVSSNSDTITVTTTGARYTFDKINSSITAEQLINVTRNVSTWSSNKSFSGLYVESMSSKEVVLTNGSAGVTFGVQMDSLLLASTHSSDLELTCTSNIAGLWNRFVAGHLIAMDDAGGFTVNPDIPFGTGRLARTTVLTSDLDFINKSNDVNFISNVNSGWQIKWTISPGERLGITTFPPKHYDWEASFESTYCNYYNTTPIGQPATDNVDYGITIGNLWNFCKRAWGMSYGNEYIPYDEQAYTDYINAAKNASIHPINYMSMYFWYNRDLDEYINEVKRHRDYYGIEGIYSDGTPSPEWLYAYQGVRRLRELFPDGYIILHTTGQNGNGGTPLSVPDIFIPAIDAYATITLRGEGISGEGTGWVYPRFVTSQYNKANCLGVQKGDAWDVSQEEQDLINLVYNGRARLIYRSVEFQNKYNTILSKLKAIWQEKGSQPDFYEAYYAPLARSLIREYVTISVSPMEESFNFAVTGNIPDGLNVICDTDTDISVADYPSSTDKSIKLHDNNASGKCSFSKKFLPLSGPFAFEFEFLTGSIASEIKLKDYLGNTGVCLSIEGGYLKYLDTNGNDILVKAVNSSTWYKVKVVADTDSDTYDIYVDDNLVICGATFETYVHSLNEMNFTTGSSTKGTVYFNYIKVFSASTIEETFNSGIAGDIPSGWDVDCASDASAEIAAYPSSENRSLKLYDNNANGSSSIYNRFSTFSGPFVFEYKFLTGSVDSEVHLNDPAGNTGICLAIQNSNLKYKDNNSNYVTVQAVGSSSWYKIKIVANTSTSTYDIYVDDNLIVTGATFETDVYSLNEINLTTGISTKGTVFFDYIKLIPKSYMYETFNYGIAGNMPQNWSINCGVDTNITFADYPSATDKSMKLYDNSTSDACSATKKFLPLSGPFAFELKFLTGSVESEIYLKDLTGNIAINLMIGDGYLKYRNESGNDVIVQPITNNNWYNVKTVIFPDSDTYDIYVDDNLIVAGANFKTNVYSLNEAVFITGASSRGTVFFDNIIISNEY